MANFDTYASPGINTAYSSQFFNDLTFQQAMGINYPTIAPPGSARYWVFANEIPTTANAVLVLPNEVVLHNNDLQQIIDEARLMFLMDKRAVHISMFINGQKFDSVYHFSKVSLQISLSALEIS